MGVLESERERERERERESESWREPETERGRHRSAQLRISDHSSVSSGLPGGSNAIGQASESPTLRPAWNGSWPIRRSST